MHTTDALSYDYSVAKCFLFAAILFGIVGMLLGVVIAFQMFLPNLVSGFLGLLGLESALGEYLTFGRLRILHTSGVIFGFMLSGIFATWYYVGQRVLKVSMSESPFLMVIGKLHFWLYMILMTLAVVSLFLGISGGKEYAELQWPLDILVVVVWVLWGVGIFGLIGIRREKALYISLWYYIAVFLGIAMLYLFNNMAIPTALVSGYGKWYHAVSMYSGANDAMVQWWYGHNAVAFVFTVGIIAQLYYFLPKESGQAVYSYKLSLFSFWGLMFIYLWAGGHHLIYQAVPDWVQTMGSIFSVILILPSWGSAINILLTMKGEWGQVKSNVLVKFMILASTFYMFSTLEGPILSVKSVNALAHFTDWIPGHVHDGTLGWVGFMTMASLYHMIPRMFKRELHSKKLMETQLWLQTLGIVLFFTSMWVAGITQGMMWRATDEFGVLTHSFVDTSTVLMPYYAIRAVGGTLYLLGFFLFAYNIIKTVRGGRVLDKEPQNASPVAA
ncbi:MAG: cytochrome-c oxidase, cbb3-type subunit I [Campylobacteraceae bacterium]|jgi:cytochrome c oxidase cbb3-type subunit 1|nr:cytochrome-c oxidase, cbb3-type subunit I [Campylobacteraceae bacterium]